MSTQTTPADFRALHEHFKDAKAAYMVHGTITHAELKAKALQVIDAYNAHARSIAKRHGVRPKLMRLTDLMR